MKNNYDVYLCRGFQHLVGQHVERLFLNMNLINDMGQIKNCWIFYYDDNSKVITSVSRLVSGASFEKRQNESFYAIGGPFKRVQHVRSINSQETLNNKILAAYDDNVARREADECKAYVFSVLSLRFLSVIGMALVIIALAYMLVAAYL